MYSIIVGGIAPDGVSDQPYTIFNFILFYFILFYFDFWLPLLRTRMSSRKTSKDVISMGISEIFICVG